MSEAFDAEWLALREPFDRAARSRALAEALVAVLPPRPHLLDLGCGTGSLFRWLAPMIGSPQVWFFADADPVLLDAAYARTADWAAARGWTVTFPQRAMLIHAPGGAWRIEALQVELDDPETLPLEDADAVTASALLDLVSADWIGVLAELLETPFLACMSVDGRDRFLPGHPSDAIVRTGFRRDQRRDKGFGRALGPAAPAHMLAALEANGFRTQSAPSDWRIPPTALAMLREIISGTADAARDALPARRHAIGDWAATRLRQALATRLAIRVGHRDILAIPVEETEP
jgi:SAM-dependent methyltransferase